MEHMGTQNQRFFHGSIVVAGHRASSTGTPKRKGAESAGIKKNTPVNMAMENPHLAGGFSPLEKY